MLQYQSSSPFLSYQQAGLFWTQEAAQTPRHQLTLQAQQQLQKLHIRPQGNLPGHLPHKQQIHPLQQIHDPQTHEGKSENPRAQTYPASFPSRTSPLSQQQNSGCLSSKLSLSSSASGPVLLQQIQPVFATQNLLVPVRIQTHVPSFGSVMYTSVSQLIATHGSGAQGVGSTRSGGADSSGGGVISPGVAKASRGIGGGISGPGFNLAHFLGHSDGSLGQYPPWKVPESLPEQQLNTGIPLSLTSGTISTTDASGSGIGGSKRMLSPASSLELFIETKQQKRVKEERMYGQIVKEMSAVELSGTESGSLDHGQGRGTRGRPKSEGSMDESERMSSSPPLSDFPLPTKMAIPVRSSAPHLSDVPRAETFTPPLQIVTERSPVSGGRDSPEELDVDDSAPEPNCSPQSMASSSDAEDSAKQSPPVGVLVQLGAGQSAVGPTLLLTDVADVQQLLHFPSLRTTSRVSWCFLNYTKPNSSQAALRGSVYGSWSVSSYNPNPLNLSTKAALALLRSKQKPNTDLMFTSAAMSPPSSGKLVSSVAWKLRLDQVRRARAPTRRQSGSRTLHPPASSSPQLKPELMPVDVAHFGRKMKGVVSWDRSKEEQVEKEVSVKAATSEPTRIKIFEGGYVRLLQRHS